ncbi:MAG: hypothetical protein DIU69_07025 [Bacillota bacterium]|nr:MAG: hypothetical protein DIU69_07025 [Bacillota bacterium]
MATARAELEIIGDSRGVERAAGRARSALRSLGESVRSLTRTALSFAGGFAIFEGASRAMGFVREAAIGMNADLEQARIGFTTMLGSARKADKFLRQMADFAAETPFDFPELLEATRKMLAFGFAAEDVLPMLQAVGDAAAGLGLGAEGIDRITRALGQMRAKAKVSAEEMLQLTEAGIPAWEILAEGIGTSTAELQKMVSKGLVPADKAIRILVEGMEKRFPRMMQAQAESWRGMVDTILDNTRLLIAKAFEPMFVRLKENFLRPLRDTLEEARAAVEESGLRGLLLALIPDRLVFRLQLLKREMQPLIDLIGEMTGWWRASYQEGGRASASLELYRRQLERAGVSQREINRLIRLHGEELAALPTVETARNQEELRQAVRRLNLSFEDQVRIVRVLGPEIERNVRAPNIFDQIAQNIREGDWRGLGRNIGDMVISAIRSLSERGREFGQAVIDLVNSIDWYRLGQETLPAIGQFLSGVWDALKTYWNTQLKPSLTQWFKRNFKELLISALVGGILLVATGGTGGPLGMAIRGLGGRLIGLITRIPLVGPVFRWLWSGLGGAFRWLGGVLGPIVQPVVSRFRQLGGQFVAGLRRGWSENAPTLFPTIRQILTNIVSGIRNRWNEFWSAGGRLADGLGFGIGSRLGALRTRVVNLINRAIDSPIGQLIQRMWTRGTQIVSGLLNGIWSRIRQAYFTVRDWIQRYIVEPIRRALRFGSPSRLMMQYGRWMVEGLAIGINRNLDVAARASNRLAAVAAMPALPRVPGVPAAGLAMTRERVIERYVLTDAVVMIDGAVAGRMLTPHINVNLAGRQVFDQRARGMGVVVTA